ncbi:MAG: glycosyltransferase [Crocinitomicaceae bacterium]|nr:glycosyltransferase [Crocinitomicaceae bacterium]
MSTEKKRILVCVDWYEPGFKAGGPIRSVANLVKALKTEFDFYILTSAFDLGETEPYPGIELNQWHDQDGVFIKYMDKRAMTMASVKGNVEEIHPDILYLNSLFSKLFTIAPLMVANRKNIPVVLAPRGMLGAGALDIKKRKKKMFITLAKFMRLYKHVIWHASTEMEKEEIEKVFGKKARINIARNIPVAQSKSLQEVLDHKNTGICRFVFISRISAKKNLHLAIESAKKLKNTMPIYFDIYGHIEEPEYYDSFKHDIKDHGNVKIEYKGVLNPSKIAEVYLHADFMVMPTRHENYGHAIVEAWANGCPVIISKYTPWKNLNVQGLGWDVDITNPDNLTRAMQESIDIDFSSYISMVRSSYNYFAEKICDDEVMNANRSLFNL